MGFHIKSPNEKSPKSKTPKAPKVLIQKDLKYKITGHWKRWV